MVYNNLKPRTIFYLFLIIFNLVSLYFIIELFTYDEIVGYLITGEKKIGSPRARAYLLLITFLLNLYFMMVEVIENFFINKM
ncbi:hypothetical protein [Flavobacterium aquidurense]|uniref:hypothetical protein n=1 Tax=Flavobacterium aquidurense TaxID=362413 RepID=UPI002854EB30|nr:hypothetical protein [Flavobacterium aquidurense]MDR7371056.1 hypothetical protein [Flavobacterium aquidurense]